MYKECYLPNLHSSVVVEYTKSEGIPKTPGTKLDYLFSNFTH